MGNSSSSSSASQQKGRKCRSLPNSPEAKRQIPLHYTKNGVNGDAIQLPATVMVTRRCPPDKVRPLPPTPTHAALQKQNGHLSSHDVDNCPGSPLNGVQNTRGFNSLRSPQSVCKTPASPYTQHINNNSNNTNPNGNVSNISNGNSTTTGSSSKHSVLDKFKLFNHHKDKTEKSPKVSKRQSSSSGFSSARSERSDSNSSLVEGQNANNKKKEVDGAGRKQTKNNNNNIEGASTKPKSSTTKSSLKVSTKSDKKADRRDTPQNNQQKNDTQIPKSQKNSTSQKIDSKVVASVGSSRKVEAKTESKTSLAVVAKQQAQIQTTPAKQSVNSGILKPMAAIKGTSKSLSDKSDSIAECEKRVQIGEKQSELVKKSFEQFSNTTVTYRPGLEVRTDLLAPQNSPVRQVNCESDSKKFNTVPSKLISTSITPTIYEEEKEVTTVLPMRPLLRGYNSHLTLPSRIRQLSQMSDFTDEMNHGYSSDGDRKKSVKYVENIESGYLSEGGGGNMHSHRQHFLNSMRARTQLPTTIEERCRSSHENNLDSDAMEVTTNGNLSRKNHASDAQESWAKMSNNENDTPSSPTSSRKDKGSPSHSKRSTPTKSSSRTKNLPHGYNYVKRSNGSIPGQEMSQQNQILLSGGRTAHVSAVPRSGKLKVSGGTQTTTADFHTKMQQTQYRSLSLTGQSAVQLSQSVKERFGSGTHSLPKGGLDMHVFQHRMSNRGSVKLNDGSLSDTQTYAEVKPDYSTYAMWLKHSNTASSRLSEGDSLESIALSAASGGMNRPHKLIHHRESQHSHSPRLNRSNSIRSTKSEKMYPSMLSRGPDVEIEPYYCLPIGTVGSNNPVPWSQPTSPTPNARGYGGLLSPTHTNQRLNYSKKNDEAHGSQASLLSGGSSLYGSNEERQAIEVRRLKRELAEAREQVMSLSSQLSTNAHVVSAFEQSLGNMTTRLQTLTATTEKKDSEILEMRQTIELLRKHSIQAGLTTAHMQSMGVQVNGQVNGKNNLDNCAPLSLPPSNTRMQRHHSSDSMCSLNSMSSGCSAQEKKKKKGWLRNSFSKAFSRNAKISKTSRHVSQASNLDSSSNQSHTDIPNHHHQSRPLPPSPTKSPHKTMTVIENAKPIDAIELTDNIIVEDLKKQLREKDLVLTDIRLEALNSASQLENLKDTVMKMRQEMMNLKQNNERLQRLVTTRSLAGSEISLGGTVSPNGSTGDNRRYSLAADNGMSRAPLELPQNLDEAEEDNIPPAPAPEPPPEPLSPTIIAGLSPTIDKVFVNELLSVPAEEVGDPIDGKKISIAVYLGQPESFNRYAEEMNECDNFYISSPEDESKPMENDCGKRSFSSNNHSNEFTIAYTYISGKTTWQNLDYIVRKTFKDYVGRIDPGTNLGLNTDSITSYHLGEAKRGPELGFPELLPCGYIIGNVKTLYICLQGVGSLAFDSLILRNIVHRYITLLTEHRRLILCGPSGTGKSYLARKLAEFLVARSGRENPADAIATFNVDHKSSKELQQYLGHIAEQASMLNGAAELPSVIILDNLHHASALGDVFSCLLSATASKLPCIIGTMSQATCNTTNLQLHHNFRWVLTANHMEPVKGFLARYLRRKLFTLELTTTTQQPQLEKVLKWLPTVWQHINSFLETHNSSDVTIGPRLFLSCPLDMKDSQVWFTDIWNYHLAPYIMDTIREGVQLYGRRGGSWVDPCTYIRESYPWPVSPTTVPTLRQITAEDVGLEASTTGNSENQDPLLNMLMRLQEAANYNGSQEPDSDCVSLASDITHDSSVAE